MFEGIIAFMLNVSPSCVTRTTTTMEINTSSTLWPCLVSTPPVWDALCQWKTWLSTLGARGCQLASSSSQLKSWKRCPSCQSPGTLRHTSQLCLWWLTIWKLTPHPSCHLLPPHPAVSYKDHHTLKDSCFQWGLCIDFNIIIMACKQNTTSLLKPYWLKPSSHARETSEFNCC